jgi:hypothetical protein
VTTVILSAEAPATRASQTDLMRDLARAIDHQVLVPPTSIGFFPGVFAAVSLRFHDNSTTGMRQWVAYLETRGCQVVEEHTTGPFANGTCPGAHYQHSVSLDTLCGWRVSLRCTVDTPVAGA